MTTFLVWFGRDVEPGGEIDLPDADAAAFIRTGQAEAVETRQIEAATIEPPRQNATQPHHPQLKRR